MSTATSVAQYLKELPADQRIEVARVRTLVNDALPPGYDEVMQYGMISWVVPLSRFGDTYNKLPLAIASLAAQKQYFALYLSGVYASDDVRARFEAAYQASGLKLDMGKSCLRFKSTEKLCVEAVRGALAAVDVDTFVQVYERAQQGRAPKKKAAPKKTKKAAPKKTKLAAPKKKKKKKKPAPKKKISTRPRR